MTVYLLIMALHAETAKDVLAGWKPIEPFLMIQPDLFQVMSQNMTLAYSLPNLYNI